MRPLPASSIWWILGILLVVAVAATVWLLSSFGNGSEQDKVQLEAIRLAGTIVLGTGGAAALFVALRRQRATELDLVQKQQAHELQKEVAAQSWHDAEQRRVTDIYTAAAEQLGHERAAVRLAGLYALQRLGQEHPEQRRPIVNVWCAYLRMPFRDPDDRGLEEDEVEERRQELQVRLTVQRLLREHAHSGPWEEVPESPQYWGDDLSVDLTGATLFDLDLFMRTVHPHTDFAKAKFLGYTSFACAVFPGEETTFYGATFCTEGSTVFDNSRFEHEAVFSDATFHNEHTCFGGTQFMADASFLRSTFIGDADFGCATFTGSASFGDAKFHSDALFDDIRLTEDLTPKDVFSFEDAVAPCDNDHLWPDGWAVQATGDVDVVPDGGDPAIAWGWVVEVSATDTEGHQEKQTKEESSPAANA